MSVFYYAVCHDCKQYVDLYKFWNWTFGAVTDQHEQTYSFPDGKPTPEDVAFCQKDDRWAYESLRLHVFLANHKAHRVGVYDEHEFCETVDKETYTEVLSDD